MIRLDPDATFKAAVPFALPGRDKPVEAAFEFRALPRKRVASLLILARMTERNRLVRWGEYVRLCWRIRRLASVVDLLDEIIVSWEDIEPAYSRAALRALLQEYPGAHAAIFLSFLNGWMEGRLKN